MKLSARFSSAKHKKYVIARAIACGVLLVLPSCQIPKLRPGEAGPSVPAEFAGSSPATNPISGDKEPGPEPPPGFEGATSSENSSQIGIAEFYNDPTLTQLIGQALFNNRELKILEQEVQIASNDVLARQGAYLPFVTFGAAAGLDKPSRYTFDGAVEHDLPIIPGKSFPDPLYNFVGGFNLFWAPDVWRELRNRRDAAAQRYIATSERRNAFVTRLVAEIAENYYNLMALDQRLLTLDQTIAIQQQSYEVAESLRANGGGNALPVQRFLADIRRNQSEKLIVRQQIIETENRINFRVNRFPQPVERNAAAFLDLSIPLSVGVPAQLLQFRPDIRQAERELAAAGLDIKVARAHFFPSGDIRAGIGYEAFNPKYLFYPDALIANAIGELLVPVVNKKAIQAEFLTANSRQLESLYNYQRVILNAFTEVINRVTMAENYRKSIELKKQQLVALAAAVDLARTLYQNVRGEYRDVLFSVRDQLEARTVLIETKNQQLAAIVNAYQALGGGGSLFPIVPPVPPKPHRYWFQRVLLNPAGL